MGVLAKIDFVKGKLLKYVYINLTVINNVLLFRGIDVKVCVCENMIYFHSSEDHLPIHRRRRVAGAGGGQPPE